METREGESLPRARQFSLSPTPSKRLIRRLDALVTAKGDKEIVES